MGFGKILPFQLLSNFRSQATRVGMPWVLYAFSLPYVFLLLALFLEFAFIPLDGWAAIKPHFTWIIVYFWRLQRPRQFSYFFLFCIGILLDFISYTHIGTSAILIMLIALITGKFRSFLVQGSFSTRWAGFIIITLIAGILEFLFAIIDTGALPLLKRSFLSYIMGIGLYPLLSGIMVLVVRPAEKRVLNPGFSRRTTDIDSPSLD